MLGVRDDEDGHGVNVSSHLSKVCLPQVVDKETPDQVLDIAKVCLRQ